MKMRFISGLVMVFMALSSQAQPFNYHWASGFGGRMSYSGHVDMVYSDFGYLYVTGDFTGTQYFGATQKTAAGYQDVYVTLVDTSGGILWTVTGGALFGYAYASSITRDNSSNTYLAGYFINSVSFGSFTEGSAGQNDIFIAKLDFSGNPVWLKRAGGSLFDEPSSILCDGNNLYLTGHFTGSATFGTFNLTSSGTNDQEIFIAKYDLNGTCIWAKSAGGPGEDHGGDICKDVSGNVGVCGNFSNTASFDGNTVTSTAFYDLFVAKYDDNGNNIWVSRGGGNSNDFGVGIGFDQQGNYYVCGNNTDTGYFGGYAVLDNGYGNIFLAKLNSSGVFQWAKGGGSTSGDEAYDLSVRRNDGNCYVTGFLNGPGVFSGNVIANNGVNDAVILRYNNAGDYMFGLHLGGSNYDQGKAIVSDEGKGVIYVAGEYTGSVSIGANMLPVPAPTNWYQFVTKISTGTVGVPETEPVVTPLRLYPNPVQDVMHVTLDRAVQGPVEVRITDATGRVARVQDATPAGQDLQVPVHGLATGRYTLTVSDGPETVHSGFVVVD